MATTIDNVEDSLRPDYDFVLPSLANDANSRAIVYGAIAHGSRVLDVGCDTGRFGERLKIDKRCIVDGIEPDLVASEIARNRLNQVFVQNIENEQSFSRFENYDAILFLDVLEHLANPWSVLQGAYNTLKPGGRLHIVVPNIAHISVLRRLLQGKFEHTKHGTMDRTHLRWFTRSSLIHILEETGFQNIGIRVTHLVPYLSDKGHVSQSIAKHLCRMFPDQFGGSIIGCGQRSPNEVV